MASEMNDPIRLPERLAEHGWKVVENSDDVGKFDNWLWRLESTWSQKEFQVFLKCSEHFENGPEVYILQDREQHVRDSRLPSVRYGRHGEKDLPAFLDALDNLRAEHAEE